MQRLINEKQREAHPQPLRGLLWLIIGGEEVILFGGFISLSWLAPSALLYALEASFFLVVIGLMQMLLAGLTFCRVSPLRERLLASFRLLPPWEGIAGLVALAHFAIAGLCIAFVILGSLTGVFTFPTYWWDIGSRFLLISADLSILFPLALRMMAMQGKGMLKLRWFLAGWTLLLLGWLVGGLTDFMQRNVPPKMIVVCGWGATLILLTIYWTCLHKFSRHEKLHSAIDA